MAETMTAAASENAISTQAPNDPRDDDQFVIAPRAALYLAFLDAGFSSDGATDLAEYALAHPQKLLEDCKPSTARAWRAERMKASRTDDAIGSAGRE